MAVKFKKGDEIQQVITTQIKGVVTGFHADPETGELQFLVEWKDSEGASASRYFNENQIELLAE
jgi:hypothetical protein